MPLSFEIGAIIVLALAFDFSNGFHDAANSIATVVSTRVLSPRVAVVWAGFFNFVAFTVLGTHVARTIGKGVIDLRDLIYFLLMIGVWLYANAVVIDYKKAA